MNWQRKALGILLTLLGSAGVAACVTGLIGTWVVVVRVDTVVSELFGGIGTGLTFVENRTQESIARMEKLRAEAREVSDRFQKRVTELVVEAIPGQAELAELEQEFLGGIERVNSWIVIAQMTVDFADQIVERVSTTTSLFEDLSIEPGNLRTALRTGRSEMGEALRILEEIRGLWAEIKTNGQEIADVEIFNSLSGRIDAAFEEAIAHVEAFRQGITKAIVDFLGIEDWVRSWVRRISWSATILLFWQGVAHVSLTVHGIGILRHPK